MIETQLGPDIASGIDWGSYRSYKDLCGTIVIVDETEEIAAVNREANVSTISLVPSLRHSSSCSKRWASPGPKW